MEDHNFVRTTVRNFIRDGLFTHQLKYERQGLFIETKPQAGNIYEPAPGDDEQEDEISTAVN